MNKKQILELYIDNLTSLDCLGKSEVKQFLILVDDLIDETRAARKLANLQKQFSLLKMQQTIKQLKMKHLAA